MPVTGGEQNARGPHGDVGLVGEDETGGCRLLRPRVRRPSEEKKRGAVAGQLARLVERNGVAQENDAVRADRLDQIRRGFRRAGRAIEDQAAVVGAVEFRQKDIPSARRANPPDTFSLDAALFVQVWKNRQNGPGWKSR